MVLFREAQNFKMDKNDEAFTGYCLAGHQGFGFKKDFTFGRIRRRPQHKLPPITDVTLP
jgi:hypothetical protein